MSGGYRLMFELPWWKEHKIGPIGNLGMFIEWLMPCVFFG
jgi:hypothetical protein